MIPLSSNKELDLWIKISIVTAILILLTTGFLLGRITDENECVIDPLVYGIKVLNGVNNDFTCSCYSGFSRISFNKDGFVDSWD